MLIAVPSNNPGGLDATISEHFGHCDLFTLVQITGDKLGEATTLARGDHDEGGCMSPVMLLKNAGVDALVCGGMGRHPLQGMQQVGIQVFNSGEASTVQEAVQGVIEGVCTPFGEQHTCGGHGHGGGHGGGGCGGHHDHDHDGGCGHHHEQVVREDVDGPVEKDRVVFVRLKVTDMEGEAVDEAPGIGFLFGHGAMVPGLEKALDGHVVGDTVSVTVPPEEGYGDHDPERIIKAPAANLPPNLEPGDTVQAHLHSGGTARLVLVKIEGEEATLDANHPFAGKTLKFEAEVLAIQEATEEDLAAARG